MKIILSNHAKCRLLDRGFEIPQIKYVLKNYIKIKNQSCGNIKIKGILDDGRILVVIYNDLKNKIMVITCYYEN
ncbi:MAG: DUF4258 domain-containing protein [Candidatus Pacebacteria bacterium]|nr:DUF4258 domain-containing protein [Candidatus Paceibacterota bacterium]